MEKINTEGQCLYCKKTYAQSNMSSHFGAHLKKAAQETPSKKKAYHLKITAWGYFLHVLMHEEQPLYDLDNFLRQIWLECCGHLSGFTVKGKQYDRFIEEFGEDMENKVGNIFKKGMILTYDYDYGSTTRLEVKVMNEYQMRTPKKVVLLTRNEPIKFMCTICNKKPAKVICALWHQEGRVFCEDCIEKHEEDCPDFADYSQMSINNSPRMGVCGYNGGSIDIERDGAWKA